MKINLVRAKHVIEARHAGGDAAAAVERRIAQDLLGHEIVDRDAVARTSAYPQHAYMTPFAATESFAKHLNRALSWLATNLGAKAPDAGKYNPLLASPVMFKDVWEVRRIADELGVPYWFYVEHAVRHWSELGRNRIPRASQLGSSQIAAHVLEQWADPAFRWHYPLFVGWDERFYADNYTGDPIQQRALALIDQRVADAKATGRNPAAALANYLHVNITEDEAERRFGAELVRNALALTAVAENAVLSAISHDTTIAKVLQDT